MDFTTAQTNVVRAMAADFGNDDWVHTIVDLEILEFEDGYDIDSQAILVSRQADGELASGQFSIGQKARDAVVDLYRQRKDEAGETIGGLY